MAWLPGASVVVAPARPAIIRCAGGTEGEAVRFYSDEVLVCEGLEWTYTS